MIRTAASSSSSGGGDAGRSYREGMPQRPTEPHLGGVVRDTLDAPGALTRLRLGAAACHVLGLRTGTARDFGTALEYFHTASLLLDDLPCMDDARLRRGRACAHVKHGEGAAILGALAFINRGYRLLWEVMATAHAAQRSEVAAHIERCLGAAGVLDGQSLDIHFSATDRSPRTVARTALGKTVALMRLALVTPVLLVDAPARERLLLDRISVAWGLAYQIADDFSDLKTHPTLGKTAGRDVGRGRPNFVVAAGVASAEARLSRLLRQVESAFGELVALRPAWHALDTLVQRLVGAASAHLPAAPATRCA